MELKDIIEEKLVFFNLDISKKQDVIRFAAKILEENGYIKNKDFFVEAVLQREKVGVTGIGNGIAIPHGKSDSVLKPKVVAMKLKQKIEWESQDGKKVEYVFLFAIGDDPKAYMEHLKLLASFAGKLGNDEKVNKILNSTGKEELVEIIRR